jgi:hypothetical protein
MNRNRGVLGLASGTYGAKAASSARHGRDPAGSLRWPTAVVARTFPLDRAIAHRYQSRANIGKVIADRCLTTNPPTAQLVADAGILTGLAAIITAATGLIVAFNRTGSRSEPAAPSSSSSPPTVSREAPATTPAEPHPADTIPLPPLHEVKLAGGAAVVTILSAQVAPIDAERRTLTIDVRYRNAGRYPANFWSSSIRLIVGDVREADEFARRGRRRRQREGRQGSRVRGCRVAQRRDASDQRRRRKTRLPFKLP